MPIVIGFGLTIQAPTVAPLAIQCAANLTGGGMQQSRTVRVIFLVNITGFVTFVTFRPSLVSFSTLPIGKNKLPAY